MKNERNTGNKKRKYKQSSSIFLAALLVFILGAAAGPLPR
jgi:hypothetical protein